MKYNFGFPSKSVWRAVLAVALLTQVASGQTAALLLGDMVRIPAGSFRFANEMALENWALEVFARRDGWVEVELSVIPRGRIALPWVYRDGWGGKLGTPVRSRAYFTPAQIRQSARLVDSLLDWAIPYDTVVKRFSQEAPKLLSAPIGLGKGSWTLLHVDVAPMKPTPGRPDSVAINLGGCFGVSDVGTSLGGAALWEEVGSKAWRSSAR